MKNNSFIARSPSRNRLMFGALLCVFWLPGAWSQTQSGEQLLEDASSAPEPQLSDITLTLSRLHGSSAPVTLSGTSDSLEVPLPLPALWTPAAVTLDLQAVPSRTLNQDSQLVVSVNDQVVKQFSLSSKREVLHLVAEIPVDLLHHGFNRVSLRVAQHYASNGGECEDPRASQLWTQFNLAQSAFHIKASQDSPTLMLSQMAQLFDRATWQQAPVVTVYTSGEVTTDKMRALGLVAQGIGQRFDFVPVQLSHRSLPGRISDIADQLPALNRVAVVVATFDELARAGGATDFNRNAGPVVAVRQLPGDPGRYAVLLLGANPAELISAASAFAILRVPWPNYERVTINEVEIPTAEDLAQRFSLPTAGSGAFPLRALGYETQTFTGLNNPGAVLKIWNNSWQGRTQVRLHLSYASGMGPRSSLTVSSNGIKHGYIPLSDTNGGRYDNYAVTIPAGSMKPGWNHLELVPNLYPLTGDGRCQPWFDERLALTIYEDSTIQKFGGSEFRLTDLSMFSGQGLLFSEQSLGRNLSFNLAATDSETLSSAMTLLGKLSQIYDRPLLNISFGTEQSEETNYHFWVGAWDQLPEQVRQSVTSRIPSSVDFRVPVMQSSTVKVYEGWDWLNALLENLGILQTPPPNNTEVEIRLNGAFAGNNFAISTLTKNGEPLILFTASDSKQLRNGIAEVIDYGLWSQLRGMLAYWSASSDRIGSVTEEDAPFSAFGLRGGLSLWVSQRPWLSFFILLALLGVMARLSRLMLNRYQTGKQDGKAG